MKEGDEGWRYEINDSPLNVNGAFPLIFDECMECGWLGNTRGVWNVGWRASTDSWAQTMWCIQEAKNNVGWERGGGEGSRAMPRRRLRPICPLSGGMPIRRQALRYVSPASSDRTSAATVLRPFPLSSSSSLTNATTVSVVTRLRTKLSGVQSPTIARDFSALQNRAYWHWRPSSLLVNLLKKKRMCFI
jgi:hypothetical protein